MVRLSWDDSAAEGDRFLRTFASACFHGPHFFSIILFSLIPLGLALTSSLSGDSGNPFLVNAFLRLGAVLGCGFLLFLVLKLDLFGKEYTQPMKTEELREFATELRKLAKVYRRVILRKAWRRWALVVAVIGSLDFALFLWSMEYINVALSALLFVLWIVASNRLWERVSLTIKNDEKLNNVNSAFDALYDRAENLDDGSIAYRFGFFRPAFWFELLLLLPAVLAAGAVVAKLGLTGNLVGFTETAFVGTIKGIVLAVASAYLFNIVIRISSVLGKDLHYQYASESDASEGENALTYSEHFAPYLIPFSSYATIVLPLSYALLIFVLSGLIGALVSLAIGLGLGPAIGIIPLNLPLPVSWAYTMDFSLVAALFLGILLPTLWIAREIPGGKDWLVSKSQSLGVFIAVRFCKADKVRVPRIFRQSELMSKKWRIMSEAHDRDERSRRATNAQGYEDNNFLIFSLVVQTMLPVLALAWLLFIGIEVANPGYLFVAATLIVTFGLMSVEAEIRLGFKAMIIGLASIGVVIFIREEVFAFLGVSSWDWGDSGYFESITLAATVFTLLLAFRVARLISRTSEEDNLTFAIYRKMELLVRRGHLSPRALNNIRSLDQSSTSFNESLNYDQSQRWLQTVEATQLSEADVQLLSESQSQLDALARSRQVDIHLGEYFAIIIFAMATIALAVLSRPNIEEGWPRLLVDLFAMVVSSVIVFLVFHVWDLKNERDAPKFKSKKWEEVPSPVVPAEGFDMLSAEERVNEAGEFEFFRILTPHQFRHTVSEGRSNKDEWAIRADEVIKEAAQLIDVYGELFMANMYLEERKTRPEDLDFDFMVLPDLDTLGAEFYPYQFDILMGYFELVREYIEAASDPRLDRKDHVVYASRQREMEPFVAPIVKKKLENIKARIACLGVEFSSLEPILCGSMRHENRYHLVQFFDTADRRREQAISIVVGGTMIVTYFFIFAHKWLGWFS